MARNRRLSQNKSIMKAYKKLSLLVSLWGAALIALPATSLADSGKVVWDYWYTVSVNKIPAEMYNEKVIMHDDKLQFMNHVWRKEEGYINEEELGAFSKADEDLTPLFFNFRSNYRTTETVVDGNVKNGNTLVVKVRKAGDALPTVTKSIPHKTFFSVFFPVWLHKVVPTLKKGVTVSFSTILEDDVEHGFDSESGTIRLEDSDEFAQSSNTKKLIVDYRDVRSIWYVDAQGTPVRTVMPENNAVIERVSKEKAEAFLK
jgi:hypothetical protein